MKEREKGKILGLSFWSFFLYFCVFSCVGLSFISWCSSSLVFFLFFVLGFFFIVDFFFLIISLCSFSVFVVFFSFLCVLFPLLFSYPFFVFFSRCCCFLILSIASVLLRWVFSLSFPGCLLSVIGLSPPPLFVYFLLRSLFALLSLCISFFVLFSFIFAMSVLLPYPLLLPFFVFSSSSSSLFVPSYFFCFSLSSHSSCFICFPLFLIFLLFSLFPCPFTFLPLYLMMGRTTTTGRKRRRRGRKKKE